MSTEHQEIKSFFEEMRKEDLKNKIPEFEDMFPKKRPSSLRYIIPVSIAASLILGFSIWTKTPETVIPEDELVIAIENADTTTETLLTKETSVFSWESSTASLINDFND